MARKWWNDGRAVLASSARSLESEGTALRRERDEAEALARRYHAEVLELRRKVRQQDERIGQLWLALVFETREERP